MNKRKNFSIVDDKLRYQLSIVFFTCAGILAATAALGNLLLGGSALTVTFLASSSVVFLVLLRLFMRSHSRIYFYLSFLFVIFLFLPVTFFLGGGTGGGILYLEFIVVIAIVTLLKGRARVAMTATFAVACGILVLLDYLFPNMVSALADKRAEALHTFLGVEGSILITSSLMVIVIHAYDTEKLTLDQSTAALERISAMDPTTGISSRRSLDDALQSRIMTSEKFSRPLSVILFDVDDFKHVNDRFGHLQGDMVLRVLAKTAKAMVRSTDELGRFGGEEFLILMDSCPLARAVHAAMEICNAIAGLRFPGQEDIRVTCSFGVVELQPGEQVEELLQRVDDKLYEAKRAGKNCVKA